MRMSQQQGAAAMAVEFDNGYVAKLDELKELSKTFNSVSNQPSASALGRFREAAAKGNIPGIEEFLKKYGKEHINADLSTDTLDRSGRTALGYAALFGQPETVKFLKSNGALNETVAVATATAKKTPNKPTL
jgi:ankyrin repeat protein